jgi:beta-glucosidase
MAEFQFPDGFLWGSATSAHQVEGNNAASDWWAWEQARRVKDASGLACDHYRRFEEDFDLAVSLKHSAHRFSIEWARIEPEEGRWDDEALAHYAQVLRALRKRRLEPIVTLHHFTTPQWLTAKGGWTVPKAVDRFARYVQRVAGALGGLARYWVTINEPMVFVRMHYLQGLGPPGGTDLKHAMLVVKNLVRAHAAAYRILHASRRIGGPRPLVSIAHNTPAFHPCRRFRPEDRIITWMTDRIFNIAMIESLIEGVWSVPTVSRWRVPEARGTLDYLGINYYGRQFIRWDPVSGGWPGGSCDLGHHPREVPERTSLGWDVCPPAFTTELMRWGQLGMPIIVTENGTWMADDRARWRYIHRHIQAMARAMQRGAPVAGYCVWSLLDNFEWAEGFAPRFGIVEVDYATQRRTVRESGRRYADICKSNRVEMGEIGDSH